MSRRRLRDRPRGGRSCNDLDLVAYSGSRDAGITKTMTIHMSLFQVLREPDQCRRDSQSAGTLPAGPGTG
jgi:hypothetical protein